jgi:hypothetical protein
MTWQDHGYVVCLFMPMTLLEWQDFGSAAVTCWECSLCQWLLWLLVMMGFSAS